MLGIETVHHMHIHNIVLIFFDFLNELLLIGKGEAEQPRWSHLDYTLYFKLDFYNIQIYSH